MSQLKKLINEYNVYPCHDIAVYSELEAEIQKHIDTNFICVNHQVKVINGVEAEHLYFLNENGSIFNIFLSNKDNVKIIWGMHYFTRSTHSIIESWTKNNTMISKFEKEESYKLKKDDLIVTIFKKFDFNINDRVLIKNFVSLCEEFIHKETELQLLKDKSKQHEEELKKKNEENEKNFIINKFYEDALISSLKRQYEDELRIRKLEEEENNLRNQAYHTAVVSSLKREYEEEINSLKEEQSKNKNQSFYQRIRNIFI